MLSVETWSSLHFEKLLNWTLIVLKYLGTEGLNALGIRCVILTIMLLSSIKVEHFVNVKFPQSMTKIL